MTDMTLAYAFIGGIIPSLLWLWFWLREDNLHSEPRLILALTFLLGMLSVAVAVYAEHMAALFTHTDQSKYIAWAAIEEVLKALVVLITAAFASKIDEPVDCMVYMVAAALGFAAVENSFFIMNTLVSGDVARSIALGDFRFIGSTLVHTAGSGLVGFMVALTFYRGFLWKMIAIALGLVGATALHSAFNLSIINPSAANTLPAFAWIWFAVIVIIILFEEAKAVRDPAAISPPASAPVV